MKVAVHLVYEGAERPYTAARVEDPDIARLVADRAVAAASAQAELIAELDPVLGELEAAEAARLRRVMDLLLARAGPACSPPEGEFRVIQGTPEADADVSQVETDER